MAGWPTATNAQLSESTRLRAYRIDQSISVDGALTEAAWAEADRISNFTQREPDVGAPASERTEIAILQDSRALYIGFWGYDSDPEGIVARRMERDFGYGSEDNFEVVIDTYNDDRNGFLFVTNPNGARFDAAISDAGSRRNSDWDGVWEAATQITEEGWFAELAIPFSTLRFGSQREQVWGINFERNIRRKREQVLWQGWTRDSRLENVARAGSLTDLENVTGMQRAEVKPYAIGGGEDQGAGWRQSGDFGADLNYLVTPNARLTVTINPDFANVESDEFQVNLTRFSLFFPEKREFFLEGREFFDFVLNRSETPFHSRRIGLTDDGSPQTIPVGARFLGKFGGATVGAMSVQTAAIDSTPSTNYTVVRWKQDVLEESTVGLIGVTKVQPGSVNSTYGVDLRYSTSRLFGDKDLSAGATIAQSYTSDAATRTGTSHRLFVSYPSDLVEFDASWNRVGPDYRPEVGFLRRRAYQHFFAELQFNPRPSFLPWIRQAEVKPLDVSYYIDDETHQMQSLSTEFRPFGFGTQSGEFVEFNIQYLGENLVEDFEIADDIVIPAGRYWFTRYEIQGSSFSGRPVSVDMEISWGAFHDGTRTEAGAGVSWRTGKHVSVSADFQRNWISLPGGRFAVSELGGRVNFAASPKLFGSLFGQWNNEDRRALFNFRVNWIPKPGTDLFLVFNQEVDTTESRWRATGTTAATKLVWRFAF